VFVRNEIKRSMLESLADATPGERAGLLAFGFAGPRRPRGPPSF
jgi:hypothetical protein